MNRRELLKSTAAGIALSQLPWSVKAFAGTSTSHFSELTRSAASPISLHTGSFASTVFNGDNEDLPHDVLWNKPGFLERMGGLPKPTESYDLVVIGGGIAGLLAAHWAPSKNVLLLEQAPRFGGLSVGEEYKGHRYSQGAAYFCATDDGSALDQLLKELDLWKHTRTEEQAPVLFQGKLHEDFWNAEMRPSARADFDRVKAKFTEIYNESYPEIPLSDDSEEAARVRELDKITFKVWLEREFGTIDPLILEFIQIYCWSSFNASIDEISAAQGLNFVAGEMGGIVAFPGGNSAISQALFEKMSTDRSRNLVAHAFVVDIKVMSDRVRVSYFKDGKITTIDAKKALFAAPKFLAKKLIDDLPAAMDAAIKQISYRAYVVANVMLDSRIENPFYDAFSLEGKVPEPPSPLSQDGRRPYTDILMADWASGAQGDTNVLSLYRPLPFDGARQFLFHPDAHTKARNQVDELLRKDLVTMGVPAESIQGIRLTRWGHALPVAGKGIIASGAAETIAKGFSDRLQFIGQDVWANPAFETAFATAERAVAKLKKA
ncbi:MAG TPA: NAD(P)-binding protein [Bdellovibrionales bacterium]|nr:NAD(P)-binding protein [Bdellovibrionales bacterium]